MCVSCISLIITPHYDQEEKWEVIIAIFIRRKCVLEKRLTEMQDHDIVLTHFVDVREILHNNYIGNLVIIPCSHPTNIVAISCNNAKIDQSVGDIICSQKLDLKNI